jgi:hypothetical protein
VILLKMAHHSYSYGKIDWTRPSLTMSTRYTSDSLWFPRWFPFALILFHQIGSKLELRKMFRHQSKKFASSVKFGWGWNCTK